MIRDLKRYPAMKDSGVEWLGKVPEHWGVLPGRACINQKELANTGMVEETVLSLSYGRIVVKPPEKLHGLVPESFETYQVVDPGDIICRPTDLQNDRTSLRFGIARDRGIITSAYMCLRPKERLDGRFGHLLLHAYDLKKVFYGLGSGLRQNLSWDDFKYLPCTAPPLDEQAAIVRYLDYVDRRVRRLVRAKRKLIELLEEQKQVIVHRAVTRGLNPDVPLRDSGVKWLGEVPEHWEVLRLRRLVKRIDQGVSPQAEATLADDGWWGVLKSGCVNGGVFREKEHKRLPGQFEVDKSLAVSIGDVLISRACGSPRFVGSVGRIRALKYRLILSDKTFRPVFKKPALVDFLVRAMNSRYFRIQVELSLSGAEGLANNLPLSDLKRLWLAVPPIEEAVQIAARLDTALSDADVAIDRAEREIKLLTEYRTRLIADVVTGKLDVREAAAALPKVYPLDEDDMDDTPETDAGTELDDLAAVSKEAET